MAGQYAKPRSSETETRDGVTLPCYRGDIVNRAAFTPADREADPELLMRGYERAALTLNFVRALVDGGFADLHHPEYWDLTFARHSALAAEYERIVESIREAMEFLEVVGGIHLNEMKRVDVYTSHEGLSLHYEQAQTRQVPRRPGWYDLTTHMPWIGMRTARPGNAHVEYFRGIRNPIAVKVGPGMTREWLGELLDRLHPNNEPGRLTLIARMGAGKVEAALPPLVDEVRRRGKTVLWIVDPMHGNTEKTASGYKTRRFENIQAELEQSFDVHRRLGSHLGGVHFELTGDDVTECIGGARGIVEADLERAYRSRVDPRLNYEQSLELAMLMARHLRSQK
jgi:3-deoxy-7-phosphoheptulonate synthase